MKLADAEEQVIAFAGGMTGAERATYIDGLLAAIYGSSPVTESTETSTNAESRPENPVDTETPDRMVLEARTVPSADPYWMVEYEAKGGTVRCYVPPRTMCRCACGIPVPPADGGSDEPPYAIVEGGNRAQPKVHWFRNRSHLAAHLAPPAATPQRLVPSPEQSDIVMIPPNYQPCYDRHCPNAIMGRHFHGPEYHG